MSVVWVCTTAITMQTVLTLKMDSFAHVILAILGMAQSVKVSPSVSIGAWYTVTYCILVAGAHCSVSLFSDIDECLLETDTCDDDADCIDTDGSYTCTCHVGFSGDGEICCECVYYILCELYICMVLREVVVRSL